MEIGDQYMIESFKRLVEEGNAFCERLRSNDPLITYHLLMLENRVSEVSMWLKNYEVELRKEEMQKSGRVLYSESDVKLYKDVQDETPKP